jgi:hypothetical protein
MAFNFQDIKQYLIDSDALNEAEKILLTNSRKMDSNISNSKDANHLVDSTGTRLNALKISQLMDSIDKEDTLKRGLSKDKGKNKEFLFFVVKI